MAFKRGVRELLLEILLFLCVVVVGMTNGKSKGIGGVVGLGGGF